VCEFFVLYFDNKRLHWRKNFMIIMGVDIGGTGIKGALVDTEKGELTSERIRLLTPQPATPDAVADCTAELVRQCGWDGKIGCGFPAVVRHGVVYTAANIDHSWIGTDAKTLFEQKTGCKMTMVNDADAAGLAEMRFGAGRDQKGVVLMVTIGTGIGTALFSNGQLVPNTELGHIEIRGKEGEKRASERVRIEKELSWKRWSIRLNEYMMTIEKLLWPDLIIIGGGVSKQFPKFAPHLNIQAQVVPAQLFNEAGIVGAALAVE
jgi:polyphosphate glucokinase